MVDLRWAGLNHDYDRVSTCMSADGGIVVTLPSCYTLSTLSSGPAQRCPLCATVSALSNPQLSVHLCSMYSPSQSRWSRLWEAMCGAQTTMGASGAGQMSPNRWRVSCIHQNVMLLQKGYAVAVIMALFLCADALQQRQGTDGDLAGILDLYFHADHPEKILFAGPALNHWITEDFGRTYTKVCRLRSPVSPQRFLPRSFATGQQLCKPTVKTTQPARGY